MSLSFLTPTVDVYLAGTTLGIGNVNASTINIGKTGTTINVGGLMNMTNTSTISANIDSLSVSTLFIGGTIYTGPTTATQLINGSTRVTGSLIDASNINVTNLSVAFINGSPYTSLTTSTANVSSNMSFMNLSVIGNFVMPSSAYMNVTNASFTNVSFSNIIGSLITATNTSVNNLSVSTLVIGGTLYTGPTTATQLINGSTIITGSLINASNVSITNLSVAFINGFPYSSTSGSANVSSNMSFDNLSVTSRFIMPSTAFMNVSNASFTNVSFSTITGTLGTITTIYSAGFYSTSDFNLKENIQYIDNKYDINQLKPCTFNFINTSTKKIGFIAQDVEQIIPESVIKGINSGLNIDYSALLSVVVDSIKQINKRLDMLSSKIDIIESIIK